MSGPGATPAFVDTGPLYAHIDEDDSQHERAQRVFDAIREGDLIYRPLYVSNYVVAELVTLAIQNLGPAKALEAVTNLRRSEVFQILHPGSDAFGAACDALEQYDDQVITLVDHMTGILADQRDVHHVITFDSDFGTLGFTRVPTDIDEI